jgi:citronellyl-CoA synthetase
MIVREAITTGVEIASAIPAARHFKPRPDETIDSIGLRLERNASDYAEHIAVLFEGREVSWGELNAVANRYAHCLRQRGIGHGDCVSLLMENRIQFLAALVALSKIGAIAGLINTRLQGRQLVHCIAVTESVACIVGEELITALEPVIGELDLRQGIDYLFVADAGTIKAPSWAIDLDAASADASEDNPATTRKVTLGDRALYIFTSGTTGLPKAAVMSHKRFLLSAMGSARLSLRLHQNDRLYLCLPLFHGTGVIVGFGCALDSACSIFLRRSFSASQFLTEVRQYETNCLIYIGELCRYLLNQPERPDDADNPLRRMCGNGLRPDIWMQFKERFGLERIAEFYGSSEGNVAFANTLNKDCTIGWTVQKIALVRYDVDADEILRNRRGRCQRVANGEVGLLLARIDDTTPFEGYTNKAETERKIVRDAFARGDAWFNSGDLIRRVDVGFAFGIPHYQFVDRVGDTYRWKSENVSTNEVGEILNQYPRIKLCNVYGVAVPEADGRAGMAAVTLADGVKNLDLKAFSAYVRRHLASYAQPVFIRLQADIEVTGTFKMLKGELRKQGYDPSAVSDKLYVMKPGSDHYQVLTKAYYKKIREGSAGY